MLGEKITVKDFKKRLLRTRLMSAILATVELTNVGMTSYAMMPSDSETMSEESGEQEVCVVSVGEMEEAPVEDLFEYLKIKSTDAELRLYYQDGTLDKTRQDVESFKILSEEKKNELFDYVAGLAYGDELEGFKDLPLEVRTEFFEFILKENYDLRPILLVLLTDKRAVDIKNLKEFVDAMCGITTPRVAGLIFGNLYKGRNSAIDAITKDSVENLILSIQYIADYDVNTNLNCKLIEYAALTGSVETFKQLLSGGAKITRDTKIYALIGGEPEIINLVQENSRGYDSEIANDECVLNGLISGNEKDILIWLQIDLGWISKKNIFIKLCKMWDTSFLIDWLKETCSAEMFNEAIKNTEVNLQEGMMRMFFADVEDMNAVDRYHKGWTALMFATDKGLTDVVEALLANGADANATNFVGVTALMSAAYRGDTRMAEMLLANGADVHAASDEGITALIAAAYRGNVRMAELLIENGADVNVANNEGTTALMAAAYREHADMTEMLLANGADVNAANNEGMTALIAAIYGGKMEIVQLLLENGADVHAENMKGETALAIATTMKNEDLVRMLLRN